MERDGDVPPGNLTVKLPDDAKGPSTEFGASRHALDRIAVNAHVTVPGVGQAQVTEIFIPDHDTRARLKASGHAHFGGTPISHVRSIAP